VTPARPFGLVVTLAALSSLACATAPTPTPVPSPEPSERAAIDASIARSLPALRACYAREAAADSSLESRLEFLVFVRPDGTVEEMTFNGVPALAKQETAQCLFQEIKSWRLPPTSWRGAISIEAAPRFTVHFEPPYQRGLTAATRAEINGAFAPGLRHIQTCYAAYLARVPQHLRFDILVHVVVDERRAADVGFDRANEADAAFNDCLLGELRRLDFSKVSRVPLDFSYPLTFR
jgi:hypothetical protein